MRAFLPLLIALTGSQLAWGACDDGLPANGSRNDVLVIVNDNAVDSCEIGLYYANARNLGKNNILHVKAPATYYIAYDDFKKYRDQVIKALQQKMANSGISIASCVAGSRETPFYCQQSINQIVSNSPIQYFVTTKGVPTLAVGAPSTHKDSSGQPSTEPVSVDGYLRSNLASYPADVHGGKIYIGRIDGLTTTAANRLVDRAINAEKSGFFGKFIGIAGGNGANKVDRGFNQFAPTNYHPFLSSPTVSSENLLGDRGSEHWRYFLGLFNEGTSSSNFDCSGNSSTSFYLRNSQSGQTGQAPSKCKAQFIKGDGVTEDLPNVTEVAPGLTSSRIPYPTNANVLMFDIAGQATYENAAFDAALNWKKLNATQGSNTLCLADTVCRNASEDALKEIDTRNVGLAEGAVGYHLISYPLTYMASWPTGWKPLSSVNTSDINTTFYPIPWLALPQVDNTDGRNDLFSVSFRSHQSSSAASCYTNDDLSTTKSSCTERLVLHLNQRINYPNLLTLPVNLPTMQIKLWYKSKAGSEPLSSNVSAIVASRTQNQQVRLGQSTFISNGLAIKAGVDQNQWTQAIATVPLSFSSFSQTNGNVSLPYLLISLESGQFSGEFKIDDVEIITGSGDSLAVTNHSFNLGNKQFGTGDWAATFTSRLNGAGFWGSVTHNCGGQFFGRNAASSVVNLFSGSSFGKAVWGEEICAGGILYGDPLYSPTNINIRPNVGAASESTLNAGQLPLIINAVNGTDSTKLSTQYEVKVCHANPNTNPYADFYVCDRENSWVATGITGAVSGKNIQLTLNAAQYAKVVHTLRLSVTSTKLPTNLNQSQTYNHFFTFFGIGRFMNATGTYDTDGDGLNDETELYSYGLNPAVIDTNNDGVIDSDEIPPESIIDTDKDGLSDSNEINFYHTDPNKWDSDGDGRSDKWETIDHTDANDKTKFKPRQIPTTIWQQMIE